MTLICYAFNLIVDTTVKVGWGGGAGVALVGGNVVVTEVVNLNERLFVNFILAVVLRRLH